MLNLGSAKETQRVTPTNIGLDALARRVRDELSQFDYPDRE
jgi:hypothetical protein